MHRFLISLVLLTLPLTIAAQPSNQWINFGQDYYKIPVGKDGIYKISYTFLQQAGFPLGIDPHNIQLFHRGVEQAIFIDGQDDNVFNPHDYILFYGRRNDGTLDKKLFQPGSKQPHSYYNLYSDTTAYFLTVGPSEGKRMKVFNESLGGLSPEEYHNEERLLLITDQYNPGESLNDQIFTSTFDTNEGWTGHWVRNGSSADYVVSGITHTSNSEALPQLELMLLGRNQWGHVAEILVGPSMRLLKSVSFTAFDRFLVNEEILWSDISADGKLTVRLRVIGNGAEDKISISYIKVNFRQTYNAENKEKVFNTVAANVPAIRIDIQNAITATEGLFDITDPNNVSRVTLSSSSAVIPDAGRAHKLLLSKSSDSPARMERVQFREIIPANHDYIIISHPLVRRPAGGYSDPVRAYAEYRASTQGGGFDTLVVNSQDLYDQFNYGEASPLAIYEFLRFLSNPTPPKYLFIIGKGLEIGHRFQRQPNGSSWAFQDLVPTGGYPGSDMVYTAGINGTTYEPSVPTGRLAVMQPDQVAAYLDKIKEMEAVPFKELWRKNILHLSGGIEAGEPEQFRNILENYAQIASGPYLGGNVAAIAKKSRDLQLVNIAEELNKGVSLVTFFGHSSATALDFDLGFVTDPVLGYNNKGKYPVLLMNGCEAGAFYFNDLLFGENWVYTRDKGASAFIAHNSFGLVPALEHYSRNFYNIAFGDSAFFGKGLGEIQKETARRHIEQSAPSLVNLSQIQQMVLLGDPAIKLFAANKPDLEIKESHIAVLPFNAQYVTTLSDSFAIKMIVNNYGMAPSDSFRIQVERVLPDNSSIFYDSIYDVPLNSDTLLFIVRRGTDAVAGNNTLRITLDPDQIIEELREDNNSATYTLSIPSNGTRNLFPAAYSIVNTQDVKLVFQATNPYSQTRGFVIELDTVLTFDSPFKKQFATDAKVIGAYPIQLVNKDSVAYYWRTRFSDVLSGETNEWATSSFTYIDNSPEGWAQIHFPQLLEDPATGLVKNSESREIEFERSVTPIDIMTFGASSGKRRDEVSVKIRGTEYNLFTGSTAFGCRLHTLNFIAFDKKSTAPYIGIYLKWYELPWGYQTSCGREPFVINSFAWNEVSKGGTRDIFQYVNNVAEGDSVVIFNIGNPFIEFWAADAKAKLGELGVSLEQIAQISSGEPVVIFGKKGSAPGTALVFKTSAPDPTVGHLNVSRTISGGFDAGMLKSPVIGPAAEWRNFIVKNADIEEHDQIRFDISGVRMDGKEQLLISNASASQDLSSVDASIYPYLKLSFYTSDTLLLTPAQLNNWFVHYTPVPEGVLLPSGSSESVELQEGELWTASYKFVNISEKAYADSLQVRMKAFNHGKSESVITQYKIKAPLPADTTFFTLPKSTTGLAGINDVEVYVNPRLAPELYYDNNILLLNRHLRVSTDQYAPVIDVTFDGRHLLNGDYVSSSPFIEVTLWDENNFLLKNDTSGVRILLTEPCETGECETKNIWLKDSNVKWYAATSEQPFRIHIRLHDLASGKYSFHVEAADASGNEPNPYSISFEVSDQKNYRLLPVSPNPLTGEAQFGFELSADGMPTSLTLQINDITGRPLLRRTVSAGFRVGRNVYTWDGTDQNGNWLAPGVYLVTITLVENGVSLAHEGKIIINR